jgi:aerobic-type carbon monoxide dehydrogenase small subunit (CoxS/CutS family)
MVLAGKNLLDHNATPSRSEIKEAISGVLCRCTGYYKIIDAIQEAAKETAGLKT